MATENSPQVVTLPAAADLSAKQYTFVKIDSAGRIAAASVAGEDVLGILQNDPDALGKAAVVAYGGVSKCEFGATLDEGVKVQTAIDGQADTAAAADHVLGVVLKTAGDGEIGEVLLISHNIL